MVLVGGALLLLLLLPGSSLPFVPASSPAVPALSVSVLHPAGGPARGAVLTGSHPSPSSSSGAAPSIAPPSDGWLMFQGGPGRNGTSPDSVPASSNVAWQDSLPTHGTSSATVTAGLVTSGGLLYVASDDDSVYAIYETNGTFKWSYAAGGALAATPALDQGSLLLVAQNGWMYQLNATTGALVGSFPLHLPGLSVSPLPLGPNVLVPCAPANLCELELNDGALLWNQSVGAFSASPAVDTTTGRVLLGTSSGEVRELYLSNGSFAWNYTFSGGPVGFSGPVDIEAAPALLTSAHLGPLAVIVGALQSTEAGDLAVFNESQPRRAAHPVYIDYVDAGFSAASPAATPAQLVVATDVGTVLAFDTITGAPATGWNNDPWPGNSNPVDASVINVEGSGTLLVAFPGISEGGGELFELSSTTGKESGGLSPVSATYGVLSTPAVDSSGVYFADDQGDVYAVGTAVPTAPNLFTAHDENESIELTWSAPSSDGGEPLSQYVLHYGPSGSPLNGSQNALPSATSAVIPGLANGQKYEVSLAAVNGLGTGPTVYANATPGSAPWPPTDVAAQGTLDTFTLTWQPPNAADLGANDAFPIEGYQVFTWNATGGEESAKVVPVGDTTSYTLGKQPNGVAVFAQVAAMNAVGVGNYTSVVSATPHLADGVLNFSVHPVAAWGKVGLTVDRMSVVVFSGNGTGRFAGPPGTYWVNATASGYLTYDEPITVASGQSVMVYVNMTTSPRSSSFDLNDLEIAGIVAVAAALLIVGIFVLGFRYRRAEALATTGEEEPEDLSEGISEEKAREILQSGGASASEGSLVTTPPPEDLEVEEPSPAPAEEEPAEEEAPEGAGGRLGELWQRRKAEKETLKNSEENAAGSDNGPSQ